MASQQPQRKPAPPPGAPPAHLLKAAKEKGALIQLVPRSKPLPKKRPQVIPLQQRVKAKPKAEAVIPPRSKAARMATALSSELLREAVEAEIAAEAECLAEAWQARAEAQFTMQCLQALLKKAEEGTMGQDELMVSLQDWCDDAELMVSRRLAEECRLNRKVDEARWWREEQAANNQAAAQSEQEGIVSTNAYQFEEDTYKETSKNGDQVKIETTDQATIDGLDASQWTEKGAFKGARKELEGVDIDIDIVDIHRREELDGTRCG